MLIYCLLPCSIPLECAALRDIFSLQHYPFACHPLKVANLTDLTFVGSVVGRVSRQGFIENALGDIFIIHINEVIAKSQAKVIAILPDQIILLAGQRYVFIN